MNIWIDLANSPHVLFFKPIIYALEILGHNVFVTHREFAQTTQLCSILGIDSEKIGIHGGRAAIQKIQNIMGRALQLRNCANGKRFDIAVSHNSYAHCIAAKTLRIPYVTIMDYEYQPANHISFRLADKILVPFTFSLRDIRKYGATSRKMIRYPGLKEEVYLWQYRQNTDFWKHNLPEVDSTKIICTVRPPATMAAYHNFENPLFYILMQFLEKQKKLLIVFFPRTEYQRTEFHTRFPKFVYPKKSFDGAQLIANSDMIISAGGTMNREAAVLGTPAYTVYAGKMGSVDMFLNKEGKIKIIKKEDDFKKIDIKKRDPEMKNVSRKVFDFIINRITGN